MDVSEHTLTSLLSQLTSTRHEGDGLEEEELPKQSRLHDGKMVNIITNNIIIIT